MSLMSEFRKEADKKSDMQAKEEIISIPTGYDIVDMSNAMRDYKTGTIDAGLREGHIIGAAGPSGAGKTTFLQNLAFGLIKPFENGTLEDMDAEHSHNRQRMKFLYTKGDPNLEARFEEQVSKPYNLNIYLDDVNQRFHEIYDFKVKHRKELMEKFKTVDGRELEVMAPTVMFIDSISALYSRKQSEAIESGEMDSNMAGSQQAITNNAFFKKTANMMFDANIYFFVVGHITKAVQTGYTPKPSNIPWLAPDENIPGGSSWIYMADWLARVDKGKALKDPTKDYGIRGYVNNFQILKSRGNESGIVYPQVFDFVNGYSNVLSNVEFLIDNKRIITGPKSYLASMPDIKFTKSTILETCEEHPELEEAISNEVAEIFISRMPKAK